MTAFAWLAGPLALVALAIACGGCSDTDPPIDPHRAQRLATFERENPAVAPDSVIFIGSSTIERFPVAEIFPGKPCVNRGVANENALLLRKRLPASLPAARPAAFILYAGGYDLRLEPNLSPEAIARRVDAIVADLRLRAPDAPIALLEVLSGRNLTPSELRPLRALNAGLAEVARARGLAFVQTNRPPLVDESGSLRHEVTTDRFHLNRSGYEALASFILADGGAAAARLRP